jgi:hypothetical protein
MREFFNVSDNSFEQRNSPWISRISSGLECGSPCPECGGTSCSPAGELRATVDIKRAVTWPDVLGCGSYPLLVVSSRVIDDWTRARIECGSPAKVLLETPGSRDRRCGSLPDYFWIDGARLIGAQLDFEASGFVDVRFCSTCGRRMDDVSATYERQHSSVWPYQFVPGTWNGLDLFTTDLAPTAFFCTARVVDCARISRHTNFRFVPVELGADTGHKGLKYLK